MKVKFSRCTSSNLANVPQIDGQLIYTKDTNEMYLDVGENRTKVSDIIEVADKSSVVTPILSKLYYETSTDILYKAKIENNTVIWVAIGGTSGDVKMCNLGLFSDYTTENRLDLNKLSTGVYFLHLDVNTFYMKAMYKGNEILGQFTSNSTQTNRTIVVFEIEKEVSDDLSNNSTVGTITQFYFSEGNNSQLRWSIRFIKINTENINTGSSNSLLILPVTTDGTQTIIGAKTFNILPKSSVVPTEDTHLVNKKYVDDNIGNINTILDSINGEVV